jgi:hypothetical protein
MLKDTCQAAVYSIALITVVLQACPIPKNVLIFPNNVNDVSSIENRTFTVPRHNRFEEKRDWLLSSSMAV